MSTALHHVDNLPWRDGTFTGLVRGGAPWQGDVKNVDIIYKKFSGKVVDGALANPDQTRLQRRASITPFQRLLSLRSTPFQRGERAAQWHGDDQALQKKVLGYTPSFVRLDAQQKHDVNNDPTRRFFDTEFAREQLMNTLGGHEQELRDYSDGMLAFYRDDLLATSWSDWESACAGRYGGADARLQQLSVQARRAGEAMDALPRLTPSQKALGVDLYLRRYLNYLVDETEAYKHDHPRGIIKSKSNPLYLKRGRLDGNFAQRPSLSMGILRNLDPCPVDLRFTELPATQPGVSDGLLTRCPDRLHMADPDAVVDRDPDSWLSNNFLSGLTPYVNGLSGSMLVEIGGMVYARGKMLQAGEARYPALGVTMATLDAYFRALAAIYTYVDGGHSLFEIQSSFRQPWVVSSLVKVFEDEGWAALGQGLHDDVEAFRCAWSATQQFSRVIDQRRAVHDELLAPLALQQSVAARGLLYHPGPELQAELAGAARTLGTVLCQMDAAARAELCGHLTAHQRLLSGQRPAGVLQVLARVATGPSALASAMDRAALVALLGDIGALFTTPAHASAHLHEQLRAALDAAELQVPDTQRIEQLRRLAGSATVGPAKHSERRLIELADGQSRCLRAGVQNTGGGADAALGVPAHERIPGNAWAEFEIAAARQDVIAEPMVGHMSASPSEILQAWDMLRGVPAARQLHDPDASLAVTGMADAADAGAAATRRARLARAAGSAGFLLGMGYHSAIEVLEATLIHTGQSLRAEPAALGLGEDAGHLFGNGAATDLIVELLDAHRLHR